MCGAENSRRYLGRSRADAEARLELLLSKDVAEMPKPRLRWRKRREAA